MTAKTKLQVKNVKISFWTNNGYVRAVRNVDFDLKEGETLAIVGESGSGKSVTARAILGILAGNAIVDTGEIYYDGKDLLQLPEEEFHHIRGNNIAMIFQDPLSSLNPIMRVGKQLTEAMIANNLAARKQSKQNYQRMEKAIEENMILSGSAPEKVKTQMKLFDSYIKEGNKRERAYTIAHDTIETTLSNIEDLKIQLIDSRPADVVQSIKRVAQYGKRCANFFLIPAEDEGFSSVLAKLTESAGQYKSSAGSDSAKETVKGLLDQLKVVLEKALKRPQPKFLAIGYYAQTAGEDALNNKTIEELNSLAESAFKTEFIDDFSKMLSAAVEYSNIVAFENKKTAVQEIDRALEQLSTNVDISEVSKIVGKLKPIVKNAIDTLDLQKNSFSYTFDTSIDSAIFKYRQTEKSERMSPKKRAKMVKKYKLPIDADLAMLDENIRIILRRLKESFEERLTTDENIDSRDRAMKIISFMESEASRMNYKMEYSLAKSRAIDLMAEVGINQPRQRFMQYPFELSGGMRQRIVIAIALASNPDVLICDEPTTALDVTIQAQILDLINELKRERNLSIIFITHDLGVVANMADKIAVMYAGKIVEYGSVDEVFYEPAHPYTWALLSSMPDLDTKDKLESIPGVPPNMIFPPKGDAFAQRNKYAMEIDFERQPPMFEITPTHSAATWLLHPDAPKMEAPTVVTERIKRMTEKMGGQNVQQ